MLTSSATEWLGRSSAANALVIVTAFPVVEDGTGL
jgi:hypothetical protein